MKLLKTKISGPKIIKSKIFKDSRGFLKEVYQKRVIPNLNFPFDVMSYSKKKCFKRSSYTNNEFTSKDNYCYTR